MGFEMFFIASKNWAPEAFISANTVPWFFSVFSPTYLVCVTIAFPRSVHRQSNQRKLQLQRPANPVDPSRISTRAPEFSSPRWHEA